jgi:hypothetical protein
MAECEFRACDGKARRQCTHVACKAAACGRAVLPVLVPQHEMVRLCKCRTREQAVATLQSPQFRRTLDVFSAALVSGRLDLRHFGLDPQVGFPRPTSFCGRKLIPRHSLLVLQSTQVLVTAACMASRAVPWHQQM